jgi:hypothetical protein
LAVVAHVPLAHRAVRTRHRIRATDDAHDEIALLQPGDRARVDHPAERLMTQNKARLSGWGPAILALHDLDIGPADTDGNCFHEH